MMIFSWIFMIFSFSVYFAALGVCLYERDKSILLGEDDDPIITVLFIIGPWYIIRELVSSIFEFVWQGLFMLISKNYRTKLILEELEEVE